MNAVDNPAVEAVEVAAVATEGTETKAVKAAKAPKVPKAPKPPKVEKPEPVLPAARRGIDFPTEMNVSKGEQEGFNTFWTIDGHKGVYSYVAGCKADHEVTDGFLVAWVKDGQAAVFTRNTNFDYFVQTVLG